MDAGAKIVPAGVDREQRRHPQQHDPDQGGLGQDLLACLAGVVDYAAVPEYRFELAAAHRVLGRLLRDEGRAAEAETALRTAADLGKEVCAEGSVEPGHVGARAPPPEHANEPVDEPRPHRAHGVSQAHDELIDRVTLTEVHVPGQKSPPINPEKLPILAVSTRDEVCVSEFKYLSKWCSNPLALTIYVNANELHSLPIWAAVCAIALPDSAGQ